MKVRRKWVWLLHFAAALPSRTKVGEGRHSGRHRSRDIEHLASACDDVALELLKVLHSSLRLTQHENSSTTRVTLTSLQRRLVLTFGGPCFIQ
jgi:hypothetical protein